MSEDREERVRQRAHEIWEREGRPHGHEKKHWEQASTEVDAEQDSKSADAAPATGTSPPVEKPGSKRRAAKTTQTKASKPAGPAKSTSKRTPARSKS
ncbi:Protein of unknown function [Mesorhizobium albiziae]|uniref:DUF2934 domain-containing protein n=1 Tax=Neomesorhizobium albiziae TaxID=335020 RepID=A0A1I4E3C0_9HYPH|nr:DUF2934 domain-containing protein [Mesorhizobium albiziae]GLS32500.1 hypothetical protein GCM10007937_42100 [Mesorhizobium albiziae]SFL00252.1 Protein of unknown function [Mesorhizobium albiziae]